ncbi:hypothetical protein [Bradyrhizobium liaoningense]|uniref:hypothetical protein n=1 Tax=Bradyrhizobium liaoningense TaxID=43992 RepID=UPI001BA6019A|nr:hypothetical protein [Bradyrhizobium liaoningense]
MGDQTTTWVALYAAIVSTAALLLNFRTWYEKGVRLHLSLMPDAILMGGGSNGDERDLMALTVVNRGGQSTTLTTLVVLRFDRPWQRWRVHPSSSFIIPNPAVAGTGQTPHELEPGKKWTGIARRRPDVIPNIDCGKYYIGIYASNRNKPYLVQIPKPKIKASSPINAPSKD